MKKTIFKVVSPVILSLAISFLPALGKANSIVDIQGTEANKYVNQENLKTYLGDQQQVCLESCDQVYQRCEEENAREDALENPEYRPVSRIDCENNLDKCESYCRGG